MAAVNEFSSLDRTSLEALDRDDPLAAFRERFHLPADLIYMNGNSLGPLTIDAERRMSTAVTSEWGESLIRGWNDAGWYQMPQRIGDKIGRLIGASPGETVVADSTSVNLFKAVAAACYLRPGRRKIVSETGNFPTDLYVLDGISGFARGDLEVSIVERDRLYDAIDSDTAVVVLTHVHYVSGEIFPMQELTARAHEAGALIVWDLSHSAGAVATDLNGANADFAVGCGYKHLNGGPGAPAYIYAAERHHLDMRQPLSGWFGHKNPFAFSDDFEPADDVRKLLCGTTVVLGASALEAGIDLMLEANPDDYFRKSRALGDLFIARLDERCADFGLSLQSPRDASIRGAHVSLAHPDGYAIMQNLIDRGVIGDFRAPVNFRLGFSPLFMRYTDVYDAVEILREILESQSYTDSRYRKKHAVT